MKTRSASALPPLNGIFPYYTMYPLEFPLRVLHRHTQAGDVVLDPFCGRGTTNLAARILPGTTLEKVWRRYAFDRQLRLLVMDGIERVEIAVSCQCSELSTSELFDGSSGGWLP